MNKALDFLATLLALFVANLFWCSYVFTRFWVGAIVALAVSAVLSLIVSKLLSKREDKKPYSADKLARELALRGNAYAVELLCDAYDKRVAGSAENKGDYLVTRGRAVFCRFKFNDVNAEDVAAIYRKLEDLKNAGTCFSEVTICGKSFDKNALLLAEALPYKVHVVRARAVYRFLRESYNLPKLTTKIKMSRLPVRELATVVLSRRNVKYYLFAAVILGMFSFFTPLKIYYIALSAVNLALALGAIIHSAVADKADKEGALW